MNTQIKNISYIDEKGWCLEYYCTLSSISDYSDVDYCTMQSINFQFFLTQRGNKKSTHIRMYRVAYIQTQRQ